MMRNVPHTEPTSVNANGIEIVYDTFGEPTAAPMLLIMGLGEQMITWDEEFCAALAAQGYWVIRFDNRDVGLSTRLDEAGVPDILALTQAQEQGQAILAPYTLGDMADDAVGLLDALEIESAHVVGVSMGGGIAQMMAMYHAGRVRTLTSIMSSTSDPDLPPPSPEAATALVAPPAQTDRKSHIEHAVRGWRVLNGPGFFFDEERIRERAGRVYDRGLSPGGRVRQLAAVLATGCHKHVLKTLAIPTLVIHGDADPLIPVECGIDTANTIPGAELMIIKGMGHDLPPAVAPRVIKAIARHAV